MLTPYWNQKYNTNNTNNTNNTTTNSIETELKLELELETITITNPQFFAYQSSKRGGELYVQYKTKSNCHNNSHNNSTTNSNNDSTNSNNSSNNDVVIIKGCVSDMLVGSINNTIFK